MAQHRKTRQKQIQTSASALTYDVVRFLKVPRLATIKTEAVKNDPASLKRRTAELEKQVREKSGTTIDPNAL